MTKFIFLNSEDSQALKRVVQKGYNVFSPSLENFRATLNKVVYNLV